MATVILVVIGLLVVGGAIALVVIGMRAKYESDPLQQRLAEFAARGETASLEQIELSQPITERVIFPVARRLGDFVTRFTPQNALQATGRKLELAGNPRGLEPAIFWALRIFLAVAIGGFLLFIYNVGDLTWPLSRKLLVLAAFVALGFYVPEMMTHQPYPTPAEGNPQSNAGCAGSIDDLRRSRVRFRRRIAESL